MGRERDPARRLPHRNQKPGVWVWISCQPPALTPPRQRYRPARPNPSVAILLPLVTRSRLETRCCGRRRGERAIVKCELLALASEDHRCGLQRIVERLEIALVRDQNHA